MEQFDPCLAAKVFKDPHLSFAYGGTADFRGRHNALYNFLSTPRLSVNVRTEEALFQLHDGALMVNGRGTWFEKKRNAAPSRGSWLGHALALWHLSAGAAEGLGQLLESQLACGKGFAGA